MGTENWGLIAAGGFAAFLANVFYMWGGTTGFGKYWRRFIGAAVLAASANVIAILMAKWTWQFILMFPCLIGGFSLGYGGDTTMEKIIKRTVYALGVLMACVAGLYATGFTGWGFVVAGLALITGLTSVALGVINPFSSARLEEYLVCQVLCLYVPWWAFVRTV